MIIEVKGMTETTEITFSDNSHIFGIPFVIHESAHTTMLIDREE